MALLQVRSFPDDMYDDLKLLARNENRSVAQQTIYLLKSAMCKQEQQKIRRQELLGVLLAGEPVLSGDYPAPTDLIREDRER